MHVTGPAKKGLERIPKRDVRRIYGALEMMSGDPFSGDIAKLGDNEWRRRVGNYRILYEINVQEKLIIIHEIKRRTSTTY